MLRRPRPGEAITIPIGGEVLRLHYPLRILKQLDIERNISMRSMKDAINSPELLSITVFYGLQVHHPDKTLDWVQDNIDGSVMIELIPTLMFAMTGTWPEIDELAKRAEEEGGPNSPAVGQRISIGSPSGPTVDMTLASQTETSGT